MSMRSVRGISISSFLVVCGVSTSQAQSTDMESFKEFFSSASWETASYGLRDHVGFQYYGYLSVPHGGYRSWDIEPEPTPVALAPRPEFAGEGLYVGRTGGVYRGEWYSPDEIGRLFRENGLFYGEMGSSAVESVWIRKKYGLHPLEGIPGHVKNLGFTGFTERDFARYRDSLQVIMRRHRHELRQKEKAYDVFIIDNPRALWLLTGSGIMHHFLDHLEANYESLNRTFRAEKGFDIPLVANPTTPREKARHSVFLQWVREKMHSIMALQMEVFREEIDPAGTVISNVHGEDVIDFETHGAIVDHPGPSGRAQFSDREMVLRYWDGFVFRLWRDLTDKQLFASSRINNGVIRARSIPTPNAVRHWHNQALQNGTIGFYQWLKDYGPRDAEGNRIETPLSFDGPAFGNPDSSTLGRERWNTVLEISRTLSRTRTFDPPISETGILLSFDALNVHGWERAFSMYVELAKAGVWNGFVSDREILNGSEDLSRWKVIYIPAMDYSDPRVAEALHDYVEGGGILVSVDPAVLSYDMQGDDLSHLRRELFGVASALEAAGPQAVRLDSPYAAGRIYSQEETYRFTPAPDARVIGVYPDGSPAVVSRTLGKGRTIYWGAPLASIYLTNPHGNPDLDGRAAFYKNLEQESGIADHSWIWSITADNLSTVTGTGEPNLPPVRDDIPLD